MAKQTGKVPRDNLSMLHAPSLLNRLHKSASGFLRMTRLNRHQKTVLRFLIEDGLIEKFSDPNFGTCVRLAKKNDNNNQ